MRKFITEIALFVLVTAVTFGGVVYLVNHLLIVEGFYELEEEHTTLVLGDSHPECAIDDREFKSVRNYSQSGESYFYTYQKVRKWLPNNEHVKTIFLEFNAGQVLTSVNASIWDDEHLSAKLPKYSTCMDFGDHMLLLVNNPLGYVNALALTMEQNWQLRKDSADHFHEFGWGTYITLENDGSEKLKTALPFTLAMEEVQSVSETNLYYLDKIIALCKAHDVRCVLIRCPVHIKYSGIRYESTFQHVLQTRYAEQEFLDYATMPMRLDEFADEHHLNVRGSKRFTEAFKKHLITH